MYSLEVQFTWHEPERRTNLPTHGLDFVDAEEVFAGPTFTFGDDRFQYPEQRFMTLGLFRGVCVSLVHTETPDRIHIIHPAAEVQHIVRGIARQGLRPVPPKTPISLRMDADVLAWFKAQGAGYQTRMNAVLRAFKEAAS